MKVSHLRILHMTPFYEPAIQYGGPVRSVAALCKGLVNLGAEVTVFTTNADGKGNLAGPVGTPTNIDGVQVYYFERESPRRFFRCPTLLSAALGRSSEFDLVHSSSLWSYLMYAATRFCSTAHLP